MKGCISKPMNFSLKNKTFLACIFFATWGYPGDAKQPPFSLNTFEIHKSYLESEFSTVLSTLEKTLDLSQRDPSLLIHSDSIFIYKHLGVVYSADPITREKGKAFFDKMLKVDRDADIRDMYASDAILEIFKESHMESLAKEAKKHSLQSQNVPTAAWDTVSFENPSQHKKEGSHTFLWVGGGVLLGIVSVMLFWIL